MLKSMLFAGVAKADAWVATLGGTGADKGYSVAVSPDGAVYICGDTTSSGAGGTDVLLAKYNSNGSVEWQRTLGGTGADRGCSVAVSPDGAVYICGDTDDGYIRNDDVIIAKYISNGYLSWQKCFGTDVYDISRVYYGSKLICANTDNQIYIGSTSGWPSSGSTYDILIAKYNSAGECLWSIGRNSTNFDNCVSVDVFLDSFVYYLGLNTRAEGYLGKLSSGGDIQWEKKISNENSEIVFRNMAVSPDGAVYVCGDTTSSGAGGTDVILAKYNSNGSVEWQRALGGTGADRGCSVAVSPDGAVYICGDTTSSGAGGTDVLLAKINDNVIAGAPKSTIDFGAFCIRPVDILFSENISLSATESRTMQSVQSYFSNNVVSLTNNNSDLISTLYEE